MKILIATGIYPPEIGGPAEYSKNIAEIWRKQGHTVLVEVFSRFNYLPSGIRHIFYFFSLFPKMFKADKVFIIDTFSAALPATLVAKILGKKTVLRTGGDFLWEAFVERTGKKILLKNFYKTEIKNFSFKEKLIFKSVKWLLQHTGVIIWSTPWQRDIFMEPYGLSGKKHIIVENYYGPKIQSENPKEKIFIASGRSVKWKNIDMLQKVFERNEIVSAGARLDLEKVSHSQFLEKIKKSYAVIISSLGDISPNTILDAISCQKPFILTKETGIYDRVKEVAIFVDPLNEKDIAEKVLWLSSEENYKEQKRKVESFSFTHDWQEIAEEYLLAYNK